MLLNIAYISYEYPPDTSGGGIGTYTDQVATMLVEQGHKVSVFCGTTSHSYTKKLNGISVYRIQAQNKEEFRIRVVNTFNAVHNERPFNLIESPDYGADGYHVKLTNPDLPYVVKLHTPTYIIKEYNNYYRQYILPKQLLHRIKNKLLRRGKTDISNDDIEFLNVQLADIVFSPSYGLAKRIVQDWNFPFTRISVVPNPYQPSTMQLNIPLEYNHNRVTFIGKLSILKGAVDFVTIIPDVLIKMPQVRFRFVGDDSFSPDPNKTMKEYILDKCADYKYSLEFTGKVSLSDISTYLGQTDIVVCNSLWENYPTVILEAMSAGRVVIASNTGGIPEILKHNKNGILVTKGAGHKISKQILHCYKNIFQMKVIGQNARCYIKNNLSHNHLSDHIIENYIKLLQPV